MKPENLIEHIRGLLILYVKENNRKPEAIMVNRKNYYELSRLKYTVVSQSTKLILFNVRIYEDPDLRDHEVNMLSNYCIECKNKGVHLTSCGKEIYCHCERGILQKLLIN